MSPALLLVICVAAIAAVIVLVARRARSVAGRAVLVAAAVCAGWVAYQVVLPPPPIAEAALRPGEPGLDVVLEEEHALLLVHGEVRSGEGRYKLALKADGQELEQLEGTLERHTETRRVMKRGVVPVEVKHLERRHEIPAAAAHHHLHVDVVKEEGQLAGPLMVSVVRRPPPEVPILLAGVVAVIVGAVADRRSGGNKSQAAVGVGILIAFALLLLEAPHPLPFGHLVRMLPIAALLGGLAGGALRAVIGLFVKPPKTATA
jgi:hypothetical protein